MTPVLYAVCTALTAICKLISQDLINAVLPGVTALLSHPKELVRKKAVMALHRFQQLDPDHEGALSGMDFDRHFRQALCDKASLPHHLPGLVTRSCSSLNAQWTWRLPCETCPKVCLWLRGGQESSPCDAHRTAIMPWLCCGKQKLTLSKWCLALAMANIVINAIAIRSGTGPTAAMPATSC